MIVKESCQYVRSYSELEGLQHAHTLYYSARRIEMGIVLELAQEQSGSCTVSRVLCPAGNFPRAMRVMRYLCENGIGPGQWLEILDDLHQPFCLLTPPDTVQTPQNADLEKRFVVIV